MRGGGIFSEQGGREGGREGRSEGGREGGRKPSGLRYYILFFFKLQIALGFENNYSVIR